MEDKKIVDLYWERSENAIIETEKKYGKMCYTIAYNILRNAEDSEECVNDTYLGAWNSMPTKRPDRLTPFLGKITRHLAINKYDYNMAKKRGGGQNILAIDELEECISDGSAPCNIADELFFADVINSFLDGLSERDHSIFMSRYWDMYSTAEIAKLYGINENTVKAAIYRMRGKLKELLVKEDLF